MIDSAAIEERARAVRGRIERAGGDLERVRIVAVTKGLGTEVVAAATAAGFVDLGENYGQELLAKAEVAEAANIDVRWHFIGQLQRNKVKAIAPFVHLWHSVDRLSVGEEIARRAPGAAVLLQVNFTDEAGKGGCRPAFASAVADGLRDLGLDLRGVMTVGPTVGGPEAARPAFRAARELADELGVPERSMGMSQDLEVAVAEGATLVRVGTALLGPRPPR